MDNETLETIRKIKKLTNLIRDFVPFGEGFLCFGTGVSTIRTNYPQWMKTQADTDTEILNMYLHVHESIHMFQLISTIFVFYSGFGLSELVPKTQINLKNSNPEHLWLPEILKTYNYYTNLLTDNSKGFTACQILECHAVLEGFRGAFSLHTETGLLTILNEAHGSNWLYSNLIGNCLKEFGFDFTFNVVPKICWLSLQAKYPGNEFVKYLNKLINKSPITELVKLNGFDLCQELEIDPFQFSNSLRKQNPGLKQHYCNILWGKYFDEIEKENDISILLDFFMHPGKKTSSLALSLELLMPPITIYNDDTYLLNGPYKNESWNFVQPVLESTAIYLETLLFLDDKINRNCSNQSRILPKDLRP